MNKNSDAVQKFFFGVVLVGEWSNSHFSKPLELSEMSRARKLILGLQVNIDKANSCRYELIR